MRQCSKPLCRNNSLRCDGIGISGTARYGSAMFREFVKGGLAVLHDLARGRAKLVAENALLRQQVTVLKRSAPRPHLKPRDRFTIATITKIFSVLLDAVAIVGPETVVRWHRASWRFLWPPPSRASDAGPGWRTMVAAGAVCASEGA